MSTVETQAIVRTPIGSSFTSAKSWGVEWSPPDEACLNKLYGVQDGVEIPSGTEYKIQYMAIGNKGRRNSATADGATYGIPIKHSPEDQGLYGQIPWVIRAIGDDLSEAERAKYAMRVITEIDGTNYICYYLRLITLTSSVVPTIYLYTKSTDTSVEYTYNSSNLSPEVPTVNTTGSTTTSDTYLKTTMPVTVSLTTTDMEELLNVAQIMYSNDYLAAFNEVGIVAAAQKTVSASDGSGGTITMVEAIKAAIVAHMAIVFSAVEQSGGGDIKINAGTSDPIPTYS